MSDIPTQLKTRFSTSKTDLKLTQKDIADLSIPESDIMDMARGLMFSYMLSKVQNIRTSFLTNSLLEVDMLNLVSNSRQQALRNQFLQRQVAFQLPVILGCPLDYVLEIRAKNHTAFLTYRDAMKTAIGEYFSRKMDEKEITQLYDDVVQPKLNSLNLQIETIKSKARKNLLREGLVLTTFGVFGLLSNNALAQIPWLLASGISASDIAKNISEVAAITDAVKTNDMYFLWRLSRWNLGT